MLQFIAKVNESFSIAEQAQMVIEGGCKWVVFNPAQLDDAERRDAIRELAELCRETSTILTIVNHIEEAREFGLHGVLLSAHSSSPIAVREDLGPEAIIGIETSEPQTVVSLRGADIDYAMFSSTMSFAKMRDAVSAIRAAEVETPLVAFGDYSLEEIPAVMDTGVSGIALSDTIINTPDPVEATRKILDMLTQ